MLAMTYLPAANLGISEHERNALIDVLCTMESGHIQHSAVSYWDDTVYKRPKKKNYLGLFNMGRVWAQTDCGTTACIAGTSDWLFGTKFAWRGRLGRNGLPKPLRDLFCPDVNAHQWHSISVKHATAALRNYLESGHPHWNEVLAPTAFVLATAFVDGDGAVTDNDPGTDDAFATAA